MARSLNASIFTLMGFIGVVLIGAVSFFVFLAKRAAATDQAGASGQFRPRNPKPKPCKIHPKTDMNWPLFFLSFLLLILATWYVVHNITPANMPADVSGQGAGVDHLIIYVHVLMGALFVGWIGYFFYVLLRFHKSRNPQADYAGVKSHASTYIEGVVAIFEAVLLIGFAIPVWSRAVDKFPSEKDSTVIKVIAQQFQWNGWYPGPHGNFCANDEKFVSGDNPFGLDKNDPTTRRISSSPRTWSSPSTSRSSPISVPWMSFTVSPASRCG